MKEDRAIDVSGGICPLGPSRKVRAAIRRAVRKVGTSPDIAVRRLERLFLSKFGIPAERLLFANSLRELTCLLTMALGAKKVAIAGGLRGLYGEDTSRTATEIHYINAGEDSGYVQDPERLMSKAGDAALLIVSNPDRVTGKLIGEEAVSRLCDLAGRKGVHLVFDESLIEFSDRRGIGQGRGIRENIVILRTTANYYGLPGLELAYAISGNETVAMMRRLYCGRLNRLSVEAAGAAFRDAAYGKQVARFLADEKRSLARAFERGSGAAFIDSDSNVYLLRLQNRPERLDAALAKAGFAVRDCGGMEGFGDTFLRMSVLGHDKNLKLTRLFRELFTPPGGRSMDENDACG
jgi:threonine-phosphate decarboxylase